MLTQSMSTDDDETAAGLSAAEAASILGVKRQTLYAYVSRGLLNRTVGADGRTSRFDRGEVEAMRQGRRSASDGELRTQIATRITRVHDDALTIRGQNLIDLVAAGAAFEDVVSVLWESPVDETWPDPSVEQLMPPPIMAASILDQLRFVTAVQSATDPLRHEVAPRSVRAAGRTLIVAMVHGVEVPGVDANRPGRDRSLAPALWRRLTSRRGTAAERRTLDAAMSLLVDHGLAGSTFAARIAASVRADPYSVVAAGLGVIGGTLHGAASAAVHDVLVDAERRGDPSVAIGDAQRKLGVVPGFGHSVYTRQDPRFAALMALIVGAWSKDRRLQHVYRVREVVGERVGALPNIDMALGSLTYLAGMPAEAGEAIFAIARTAGWLAHAMEEYDEKPLRFRPKARHLGSP